jgi:glutathione S-transferase
MPKAAPPLSLLTFAPMVNSETSRFILAHYGTSYVERPHVFAWGSLLALRRGFSLEVPLLFGNGLRLVGPRAIVDHFDAECPRELVLVPTQQPWRTRVEADWQLFNGELAAHVAVLAYFHLLPHPDILTEPFFRGVPQSEKAMFGNCYPLLRALLSLLLRLSRGRANDALRKCRLIFDHVDRRVADGRLHLDSGGVTLADLSLAAAAAPLLLPAGYRAPIPALETMPAEMQAIVHEMRQHPAAEFVAGIYRQHMPPG